MKGFWESERGATILMALLALMVVAMISAVILAAATSTVKQSADDREFQQTQLDLQSAAEFAAKDIESIVVEVVNTGTSNDGKEPTAWDPEGVAVRSDDTYYAKPFKTLMERLYLNGGAVEGMSIYPDKSKGDKSFEIVLDESTEATSAENKIHSIVSVEFTLKKEDDPNINTLTLDFKSGDGKQNLCAKFSGKVSLGKAKSSSDDKNATDEAAKWVRTDAWKWTLDRFYTAGERSSDED